LADVDPFLPEADDLQGVQDAKEAEEQGDETRAQVELLRASYIRVFKEGVPSADDRRRVMEDLEVFARGERTPWHPDERIHCVLTGRHEVYTRIKHHITLSLDVLFVDKITPKR
jgi:hypothetical protein